MLFQGIFVHPLKSDGELLAQHDAAPVSGVYPTSQWVAGGISPRPTIRARRAGLAAECGDPIVMVTSSQTEGLTFMLLVVLQPDKH